MYTCWRVNDLRPISVAPILSRLVERLIVRDYIYPAIPSNEIIAQYSFKLTGSTTAALVDLTNRISVMLEENKYRYCLLIDFTKAFDSVDHLTLVVKLKNLNIADNIIQCVVLFLTNRNQFIKSEK